MPAESVFSFYMTKNGARTPDLPVQHLFGEFRICTDENTPYTFETNGSVECLVFGLVTNVVTGDFDNIAEKVICTCKNITDVVELEKQLGGKYILFCRFDDNYYIIGDATCSIPVYYNTNQDIICTSNYFYIKEAEKYSDDPEYLQIRKSGDLSQAMPYDITPCREIRQLLPNHFLDINSSVAVRFVNAKEKQLEMSVDRAAETVRLMIENLVNYYSRLYKIYCPFTAGRDSRVVLASLDDIGVDFSCYTIKHPEHHSDEQDLAIPEKICEELNIPYEWITEISLTDEHIKAADKMLGRDNYSLRTLRIAHTIKKHYGDGAVLNGDIIGQVGKCSLHRDIPPTFATPSYFRCKLHNYSHGAKKQLKFWLAEIKSAGEQVNTFDLFSVENRMGRWAGQENLIYNSIGQIYLNIFNSRSIIYALTAVNREERKTSAVHERLICKWYPDLASFPYKVSRSRLIRFSKANWFNYLVASYIKYYIDKKKFNGG